MAPSNSRKNKLAALSASKSLSALASAAQQNKYENCTIMSSFESASWAWDMLWYQGQQNYVKLKILDTIRIEHGNISSWLFTMNSDGFVKSRTKARWNLPAVFDKCMDTAEVMQVPTTVLKAHCTRFPVDTQTKQEMKWEILKKSQLSTDVFDERNDRPAALIAFNRIEGSGTFAEISLEINVNSKAAISEKPKVVTHTLYTGHTLPKPEEQWMEKKEDVSAFPPKRLVCVNKQTCTTTEAFITDLRKILEDRSKCKIVKLTAIVLLEGMDEGEKVVWLHHVKDIILANKPQHSTRDPYEDVYDEEYDSQNMHARDERFERRSNATSDLSVSTTTFLKRQQQHCSGDFCECPMDEEGVKAALDLAPETSFKQELQRARARNKRVESKDGSPVKDADGNPLGDGSAADYADSSRGESHTGLADTGIKKKINRTVPMKSISLCRKEAESWELTGRAGHFDGATMPWSQNVFDWWFGVGKYRAQHRNSGATVPISSAHNITKSIMGMKPINEETDEAIRSKQTEDEEFGTLGDLDSASVDPRTGAPLAHRKKKASDDDSTHFSNGARSGLSKSILYDLDGENSYTGQTRRSVGQLSWYYSEAKVCQTCYQTYRDIDRRREAISQKQLKAMKRKQALSGVEQAEYDRDIEKKIFEQRRMASRLAVPVIREEGVEYRRSGTSPADVHAEKQMRRRIVGAPKGVLPPLPWQLRDKENAENYENNKFSSSIVRNIRTKAQGMARAVQQDKLMERVDMKQKRREKMMMGGMLDEHSQMLDENSQLRSYYGETQEQWQQYTGQSRMESEMLLAEQQKPRKVIGGLGENRPKGKSKNFDTRKLMHGWQRDAEDLAKRVRGREQQVSGHGTFNPEAKERRRNEAAARASRKQTNGRNGGFGKEEDRDRGVSNGPNSPSRSPAQRQTRFFPDESMDVGINGLQQGSMVSQLTMDASMANLGNSIAEDPGNKKVVGSYKQQAIDASQASLDGLDDEEWINAIMVKGKGSVPVSDLLDANGSIVSQTSKKSVLSRSNGGRTPKGSLRVSFQGEGGGGGGISPKRAAMAAGGDSDDDDDDDDDDGAIGWSPFVIPAQQ